jgi:GTP cyclohydrolase I
VTANAWLTFPWEGDEAPAEDAVVRLLEAIGEDPTRAGLLDTPARVVKALGELTAGMSEDPATILARTFDDVPADEMIVVRGVEFTSLCEHHVLPFTGLAHVGYIPNGHRVVGLSKLARLVDCFARRLQVQERMTAQIANAIDEHLDAVGVGVVVQARHACMGCRGVRKPGAEMVTSALLGAMRDQPAARAEFLAVCGVRPL